MILSCRNRWIMSAQDRPSPGERICSNCHFLSFTPGADLRCADPAGNDFDRPVQPTTSCGRFQISFAAAKLLAFRDGGSNRPEAWELAMHCHLTPRSGAPS
jgi:hypothetical protein